VPVPGRKWASRAAAAGKPSSENPSAMLAPSDWSALS
jgi:hypothetical protein